MNSRDIIFKYLINFRIESNRRMSMIPGVPNEIPFYIYDGAHDAAKEATISQLELKEDDQSIAKMNEVYEQFMKLFKENEHYSDTDDLIVKEIEEGKYD